MALQQHRLKEHLGGVVSLLTIDATNIKGNATHIRRFVNSYGEDGLGVAYQGNQFVPCPYQLRTVKRNAKSSKSGSKISIGDLKNYDISRFIDEVGGLEGARVYETRVYERYLDNGAEPNPAAYIKRLDHEINYVEESEERGEMIIHTIDPLSKDVQIPRIQFSAGIPNDTQYHRNVFPAVHRDIAKVN